MRQKVSLLIAALTFALSLASFIWELAQPNITLAHPDDCAAWCTGETYGPYCLEGDGWPGNNCTQEPEIYNECLYYCCWDQCLDFTECIPDSPTTEGCRDNCYNASYCN